MHILFRKFTIIILSLAAACAFGMERDAKKQKNNEDWYEAMTRIASKKGRELKEHIEDAGKTGDASELLYMLGGASNDALNSPFEGSLPLMCMIKARLDSAVVAKVIIQGARVDLKDDKGRTLFHLMARCIKKDSNANCSPKMNFLSALALPEYNYDNEMVYAVTSNLSHYVYDARSAEDQEYETVDMHRRYIGSRERLRTALLCFDRINRSISRSQIKYAILGLLQEDVFCLPLFVKVIDQVRDKRSLVATYPLHWFQVVAYQRTGDDRAQFINDFAPLIARYRLDRAEEVLTQRDDLGQTAYEQACTMPHSPKMAGNANSIQAAHQMMEYLEPEGFVDRHLPECTKVIANMLQLKMVGTLFETNDPFLGFKF